MEPDDVICLKRAAQRARRSPDTIRRWCKKYSIARQSGPQAPLEISALALEMILHGDFAALDLLRRGDRAHPSVQRYVAHLGLPA
jgi:hypothetical protein